jgi:uncharacterized membrane protein
MKAVSKPIRQERESLQELTLCGVFTALICIFTMFIQIQIIPGSKGGMVHLGNVPLFFAAAMFGKKVGGVGGGLGMALSDLLSGWTLYAPITFIVVALMGYVFGSIVDKKPTFLRLTLASASALVIKLAGYYLGELILYRNAVLPIASIPGNILQVVSGAVIAVPIILVTKTAVSHIADK